MSADASAQDTPPHEPIWAPADGQDYRLALALEISAENNLITNRMTWNLTFQGFLFTGYALALGRGCPALPLPSSLTTHPGASMPPMPPIPPSDAPTCALTPLFLETLPYAGMAAAAFALIGVIAALWQIYTLQTRWSDDLAKWGPKPFSDPVRAWLGATPPFMLPVIVFGAWFWLSR